MRSYTTVVCLLLILLVLSLNFVECEDGSLFMERSIERHVGTPRKQATLSFECPDNAFVSEIIANSTHLSFSCSTFPGLVLGSCTYIENQGVCSSSGVAVCSTSAGYSCPSGTTLTYVSNTGTGGCGPQKGFLCVTVETTDIVSVEIPLSCKNDCEEQCCPEHGSWCLEMCYAVCSVQETTRFKCSNAQFSCSSGEYFSGISSSGSLICSTPSGIVVGSCISSNNAAQICYQWGVSTCTTAEQSCPENTTLVYTESTGAGGCGPQNGFVCVTI